MRRHFTKELSENSPVQYCMLSDPLHCAWEYNVGLEFPACCCQIQFLHNSNCLVAKDYREGAVAYGYHCRGKEIRVIEEKSLHGYYTNPPTTPVYVAISGLSGGCCPICICLVCHCNVLWRGSLVSINNDVLFIIIRIVSGFLCQFSLLFRSSATFRLYYSIRTTTAIPT